MMIKLSGHSLTAADRFQAERLQLQLSERQSTAVMTVPDGDPSLNVGDWLQIEKGPGAGIVWRVKTIDTQTDRKTRTVTLEHAINTLRDRLMFGKITTQTISGGSTATATQAINYILGHQSDWQLGTIDYTDSNPYHFNGDDLFSALETVSSSLDDCIWEYSFASYPFTINIRQKSSAVASEMRMDRNIRTLKKTIDRSRMYTRIYPTGKNNLKLDSSYLSKNENLYGVISKPESDESIETQAELQAWAQARLNRHCEPVVTVTISGLDLSAATGEDLDSFTIGRICRVPLPEFSTTITERVTKLSYNDAVNTPEDVTVTLANELQDVATILREQASSGARSGRNRDAKDEEDHAWFVDTTDHVSMVAEAVAGKDDEGNPDWSRVAELTVSGSGIDARVTQTENDIITNSAAILMTQSMIALEVADARSDLQSSIEQTASTIQASVSAAKSSMYTVIEQTATSISSQVSRRARVFVQLNDPSLDATISLMEGDIWIQTARVQNWDDMSSYSWSDTNDLDWNQYTGAKQYAWDAQKQRWEPIGDRGQMVEWGTRIDQNEKTITLLAHAIGAIDPSAIAEIDISADAITMAVSTAKSELYSVIRQTATNISTEVASAKSGLQSYIDQTASSISSVVAQKNRVWVQLTDPATNNTVIDGDIWIKAVLGTTRPTWTELSAKSWSSQSSVNWREYYSSKWYVRKNNTWQPMREDADVVEIGTKVEQDEQHIALIARTVDANHIEMGSRLEVTAQQIRAEVHAAKSSLYSVIEQTATYIRTQVASAKSELQSSIEQTASSITTSVNAAKSALYSTIRQTATNIMASVADDVAGLQSSIEATASSINIAVRNAKSDVASWIDVQANRISLLVEGTGSNAKIKPAAIVSAINNQTGQSTVKISADMIVLDGDAVATSLMGKSIGAYFLGCDDLQVTAAIYVDQDVDWKYLGNYANVGQTVIKVEKIDDGSTLKLTQLNGDITTFSKATTLTPSWSGSTLTVTATQINDGTTTSVGSKSVGFGGSYGSHDVELGLTQNGYPSKVSSSQISVPLKVIQQQGGGATTDRYSQNLTYSIASLLTTGSFSSSGTKTPGSDYIGFSSVTFNIPDAANFAKNDGQYSTYQSQEVASFKYNALTANTYIHWTVGGKKYHITVNP